MPGPELWTTGQAAQYCGITRNTLHKYRSQNGFPAPLPDRRAPDGQQLFVAEEVKAWQAARPGRGWWNHRPGPHHDITTPTIHEGQTMTDLIPPEQWIEIVGAIGYDESADPAIFKAITRGAVLAVAAELELLANEMATRTVTQDDIRARIFQLTGRVTQ